MQRPENACASKWRRQSAQLGAASTMSCRLAVAGDASVVRVIRGAVGMIYVGQMRTHACRGIGVECRSRGFDWFL
jgi:hypothetical protein